MEVIALALTTLVRPTSATAVAAMLAGRNPTRLLTYYIVVGLIFSLSVGALVVLVLEGLSTASPSKTHTRPLIDTVLGAGALSYAGAVWIGWLPRQRHDEGPQQLGWLRTRLRDLTPTGAAMAGILTHLPGLVYLAALNAIVVSARGPLSELSQVAVYNLIWFSLAIVALVLSVRRPDTAGELLDRLASIGRRHRRAITIGFFTALGGYLVLIGLRGLLEHRS